jgi:hypothetical protein
MESVITIQRKLVDLNIILKEIRIQEDTLSIDYNLHFLIYLQTKTGDD